MPVRNAALAAAVFAAAVVCAAPPANPPGAKKIPRAKLHPEVAAAFEGLTSPQRRSAERWLRSLTLREKAGQLIIIPFYGENPGARTRAYRAYRGSVRDLRVGGLVLVNRLEDGVVRYAEAAGVVAFVNRMQKIARVPLLVAGDFERGASMRVAAAVRFPHAMAYGAANDPAATRALGAATARESRALGVHWIFAPVADVNSNPDNPVINTRSFGEDPRLVSTHVRAFIEGAHSAKARPVLVTAKHFPGHGDTAADSHLELATIPASRPRLDQVELAPFRAAIAAGVDAVMTAHIAVPAVEKKTVPATVSAAVLTGLLREEMKFRGLVVTDAMDMQGLAARFAPGEAAVRALLAGADVLLMPPKPAEAARAVVAAVKEGRLAVERIDRSVARILAAKARVGLGRASLVNPREHQALLGAREAERQARAAAEAALTAVRIEGRAFPPADPARAAYFLLVERPGSGQGRQLAEEIARRAPEAKVLALDPSLNEEQADAAAAEVRSCDSLFLAAYSAGGSFSGESALPPGYRRLLAALEALGKPAVLAALGSPYLLRAFPGIPSQLAAFSTSPASESALARAIFSEIPVRGTLPVTIPGVAAAGAGIDVPPR